jgi:hypothetical protein
MRFVCTFLKSVGDPDLHLLVKGTDPDPAKLIDADPDPLHFLKMYTQIAR